jgi:lactate dehydrogenase-like 2-hydroxyacid dehydrogenase
LGKIVARVAAIARNGFGMQVFYGSRKRKLHVEESLDAKHVALDPLFRESDVVSLHCDLNQQTKWMINQSQL